MKVDALTSVPSKASSIMKKNAVSRSDAGHEEASGTSDNAANDTSTMFGKCTFDCMMPAITLQASRCLPCIVFCEDSNQPTRVMRRAFPIVTLLLLVSSPLFAQDKGLPLEIDRTIPLDVTSGTWMSLDVSPDGSRIVFDLLGDLYEMPFQGGDATRLTSGLAFDSQPRYSPDGAEIVFSSDRDGGQNIWTMSLADSTFKQISKGSDNRAESPDWMPDGNYIVASIGKFRGGGLPAIKLFHVDGGSGITPISDVGSLKFTGAAPSPDGSSIWYARRSGDWQYNAQFPQYQLEEYVLESGERYTRSARYGSGVRPTLSPDGRWLVYGTRHDAETGLIIRDLSTQEERWLAYPIQHDDQESRATLDVLPGMSFTPDSKHLLTTWDGKIYRIDIAASEATEIPFRVKSDLELAATVDFDYPIEDTPTFTVRQIRDAVPSPDGTRMAFTALDRLWTARMDGTDAKRVTDSNESEHFPAWSPDGSWIAYATWNGQTGHLKKAPVRGGRSVQLTAEPGLYFDPAWSPDDRIVAFRTPVTTYVSEGEEGRPGQELVWVPAGNGTARAVVIAPGSGLSDAHFTDSSDRIYLRRSGDTLVSMRWDGTDEKTLVKVRGPKAGGTTGQRPSMLLMAPRGDQALAEINRHIYTVTVPAFGNAPTLDIGNPKSASVPARQLTDIGGEFPSWSSDGRSVHFTLGNALFTYNLDDARAFDDSLAAVKKAAKDSTSATKSEDDADAPSDSTESKKDDKKSKDPKYTPSEVRFLIDAPRDIPQGTLLLSGARIITMKGDEVLESGDILIRNNRIQAVGAAGALDVPADATVRDVSGKTIVPGFVDTHAHLRARDGIHRTDQWAYLANLAYGVTTARDPQTGNTEVLSYGDMVRTGQVMGPRVYSTGPGVFWNDGIDTLEEARNVLKRYSDYFDTKTIKMYVSASRKGRQYIIQAARELELMPTTEGSLNLRQNLTETLDGYPGLEHSLPVFPISEDVKALFVATQRVYTPTLLVSYGGPWAENYFYSRYNPHDSAKLRRFTPHDQVDTRVLRRGQWFHDDVHVFKRHAAFVRDLVAAGGRAGVGSHGQLQGLGYHWELWAMASADMPPHDALKTATLFGAEAIGLDNDLGSIEPGKLADLVILDANPLDDIHNTNAISGVMLNGRLYHADTLNQVWPSETPLADMWWWNTDPVDVPGNSRPIR